MEEKQEVSQKGTVDPTLLAILCCPDTKQSVALADEQLLNQLNTGIGKGEIQNKAGQQVKEKLDAGLIREDRKVLYPIRDQIPIMLIDEGILLET